MKVNGTVSELAILGLWGACCAAFGVLLGWWAVLGLLVASILVAILTHKAE